jgi:ribosomal protein S27E
MSASSIGKDINVKLFRQIKDEISLLDPVSFAENHLTVDGKPFRMSGTGWKFMADLYREVAAQATNKNAKPMVILKGRQIGATVLAAVLSLYFTASGLYGTGPEKPPMRVLHVFPTLGLMSKYAKDKLGPMVAGSQNGYVHKRLLKNDPNAIKMAGHEEAIAEKTFIGYNKLRIEGTGADGDRIRGLSQDAILFDECQDMPREAIETAGPILTSAQYGAPTRGIQLYFGTPKGTGSYFYNIWQKSDQRFYQLRCVGCSHYFFLYTTGSDSWKKIWVSGHDVKCPECGNIQKKADAIEGGRWMPTKSGDTQYVGYHVSVLLHPWFTKESILDLDPSVNKERSEKAWKNETLGEFYSGGGMTISLDDIRANCHDLSRGLAKSIIDRGDKTMVMGIDWGGKDLSSGGEEGEEAEDAASKSGSGQSYTAVVIMSVDKNGIFTIENAYRLKRNDFEYKVNIISEMYRLFKVQVAAADIGYGQDIVQHMQGSMGFGERFLGCINSGTLNSTISYKPKELRVVLNKDAMVEEVFSMVRNGKIKFPVHGESYDRIEWLMQHFTSMEVKRIVKNDNVYNRYVKGAIQNDGLMAAIYAMIAYKFIATSGFKGSEIKAKGPGMPGPMLAYLPRI